MLEPEKKTITLKKAIEVDGVAVTELTMREPLVSDQLAVENSGATIAQQEVAIIANLCDVAPVAIKSLTMRDYKKVQAAYMGFTE